MRAFQFWVLLFGSLFVSGLMLKQISLSRSIFYQQRTLVDNEEIAASAGAYKTAWHELALQIYEASKDDPTLAGVLKTENVKVGTTPPSTKTAPSTAPANSAATKAPAPATPLHVPGT